MNSDKEIRWRQRFETFEQSFQLLQQYSDQPLENALEKAGYIHMFEAATEHAHQVFFDFLDAKGISANSERQAITEIAKYEFIRNERTWLKALNRQKLANYIHTEKVINQLVVDIRSVYLPEMTFFYQTVKEQI
ncbi:nucleotidyltransferase substrate binding protein [Alkalibacillus aidingensis]|uniref:nucleotidyltransferase substrate binding protein n=1 Tax=Alkalibacillus aidingensis TaxID=2747607 RepID=UPI001660A353|nr:nucleotidyltransferase substrate binding protein [Alkalibacillus aidingensis]